MAPLWGSDSKAAGGLPCQRLCLRPTTHAVPHIRRRSRQIIPNRPARQKHIAALTEVGRQTDPREQLERSHFVTVPLVDAVQNFWCGRVWGSSRDSKAVSLGKPTALPCPPYVPFSWTALLGVEPAMRVMMLCGCITFRPHASVPRKGRRPIRPVKSTGCTTAFLRLTVPALGEKKAPTTGECVGA